MGDILDLIDGAVAAHELSGDGMRWAPDAPPAREWPTLVVIDEKHHWLQIQRFDAELTNRCVEFRLVATNATEPTDA